MAQQTFQRSDIYRDFDLSMSRNPLTNDVSKKADINSINQSLKMLFNTYFYERPFRPQIGANVRALLFEPVDIITIMDIKSAIEETIINNEPRVNIRDVKIRDLPDKNAYSVFLEYTILNTQEAKEIEFTLKRLR